MTVVYVDSVFALNLLINYLLLLTSARIVGVPASRLRLALGALVGAVYAVCVLLPGMDALDSFPGKLLSALTLVAVAHAGPGRVYFGRLFVVFFAVSLALGGAVYAIGLLTLDGRPPGAAILPIDGKTLLLTAGLSYALLTLVLRKAGRHAARETVPVILHCGLRKCRLTALLDSGHTLTDPLTGQPVLIVDGSFAPRLLADPPPPGFIADPAAALDTLSRHAVRFRLIPYRAVGVSCAFLLAFRPDCVFIDGKLRKNMLVALSPTPVSDGNVHHALLGGLV